MNRFARCAPWAVLVVMSASLGAQSDATYRCWSFNVDGAGGRCPRSATIVLNQDGTYQESTTKGTYTIKGDEIVFSKSTVRGPGRIKDQTIVFTYVSNGKRHTVTYLLFNGKPPAAKRIDRRQP